MSSALTVSKCENFDPLKRAKNSVLDQKIPVFFTLQTKFTKSFDFPYRYYRHLQLPDKSKIVRSIKFSFMLLHLDFRVVGNRAVCLGVHDFIIPATEEKEIANMGDIYQNEQLLARKLEAQEYLKSISFTNLFFCGGFS